VAYRLRLTEPVPQGIRRIVREEIAAAVRHLAGQGLTDRDEAIHEARKNIKKIRGALRLVQPELGEIYGLENAFFREIGRRLSQFRDAGAILETFDGLRARYRGEAHASTMASIRRRLVARKAEVEKQDNIGETLAGAAEALRQSEARAAAWPLSNDGFPAIAAGLEATFRRGQKAMARARKHPRPENDHEWRKRVKEHWYHVRLLESAWDGAMPAYERRLKDLETFLGEGHNLVVLRERPEARQISRLIGEYREELRRDALALGERIYTGKPAHFTKRVRDAWMARHSPPSHPEPLAAG
jgi:CHAD domain-containing protein